MYVCNECTVVTITCFFFSRNEMRRPVSRPKGADLQQLFEHHRHVAGVDQQTLQEGGEFYRQSGRGWNGRV